MNRRTFLALLPAPFVAKFWPGKVADHEKLLSFQEDQITWEEIMEASQEMHRLRNQKALEWVTKYEKVLYLDPLD